ncbi:hypothetical protein GWC77_15445 [Paraburkholderia sp. NMBU_R16]|uniref:hypothetical protein n=1 Tax=Paraburkholderia sp. NMBU_R16 TaxID=2698676 RepID=UPI001566EC9D|nr:hypothetical protein [Paraburkholderia sp. NMBU_R16]NRO97318.1 hypothetical protein [Paraburkholderia sp. NMBU_R16]
MKNELDPPPGTENFLGTFSNGLDARNLRQLKTSRARSEERPVSKQSLIGGPPEDFL